MLASSAKTENLFCYQVHDLLLYPDKEEWCDGMEIEMILTHPGCQSQVSMETEIILMHPPRLPFTGEHGD